METCTPLTLVLTAAAVAIPLGLACLVMRRDTRRVLREFDARDRACAQRQALREMAWQIRDEIEEGRLSDAEREIRRRQAAEVAEIRREARRRLGLPEEDAP